MDLLTKDELTLLVNLGFAACMKGEVALARSLFNDLCEFNPDLKGAQVGRAFSYIVTDNFAQGEEILQELLTKDPTDLDIKAFLAFSKALQQKSEEVLALVAEIPPEAETAYNLAQEAKALLR